jgi:hypothetical protein
MRGISSVFQLAVGTSATHETGGAFDDEEKAKEIMSHIRWMLVVTSGSKFASLWSTELLLEEMHSHLVAAATILCKECPAVKNNSDEWRKRALEMINESGERAEARLLARKLNEIQETSRSLSLRSSGEEHGTGYDSEEEGRLGPTSLFRGDVGEAVCSISAGDDANDQIGVAVPPPLSLLEATAFVEEPKSEANQECSLSESDDEVVSEASIRSIRNYQRQVVKSSLSPLTSPLSGSIACSDCEQEVKAEFDVVPDPSALFRGDVGEEVRSQASRLPSLARAVSSPDSPSTCERYAEAKELDNPERGGDVDVADDQGNAASSTIPSPNATVPPPLSSSVSAEDRDEVKDDEPSQESLLKDEEKLLSSLLARIQNGEGIIAVETHLNQVVGAAVERIFDPQQPQYNLLARLVSALITVLTCNDNANENLYLEHSGKADSADWNVIGLGVGVAWGDIASKVERKTSDKEGSVDLPENVASFLEDAREAVSLLDNPKKKKLETFVKFGNPEKFQLGNLVSLAMMQVVLDELTPRKVTSTSKKSQEWRADLEELWGKILPRTKFNEDESLSIILMIVLRPGLNSTDEEIFILSCVVMHGTIKMLTLRNCVAPSVRPVFIEAYKKSQSMTADGKIGKSSADYCGGDNELQSSTRTRMVVLYFSKYAHDILVRRKLSDQETTGKNLLRNMLITGQESIRKAFSPSFSDIAKEETKKDMTDTQLEEIRKILGGKRQKKRDESRMLLIDCMEQITSMQNILEIAKPKDP